jgi:hypothetical protein
VPHLRHHTLVLEEDFDPARPDRLARLRRFIQRSHHAMPLDAAERLEAACLAAVPALFDGLRIERAAASVRWLMRGQAPMADGLVVPGTGDIPRAVGGVPLAEAMIVLRALRPSRVPLAGPALVPHLSALRVLLRCAVPDRLRLVTWVALAAEPPPSAR